MTSKVPKIYNIRTDNVPKNVFYIGRPSRYGNPYSHKQGKYVGYLVSSRDEAISKYIEYFEKVMKRELPTYYTKEFITKEDVVKDLRGKDLSCFCTPLRCHAQYLIKIAN